MWTSTLYFSLVCVITISFFFFPHFPTPRLPLSYRTISPSPFLTKDKCDGGGSTVDPRSSSSTLDNSSPIDTPHLTPQFLPLLTYHHILSTTAGASAAATITTTKTTTTTTTSPFTFPQKTKRNPPQNCSPMQHRTRDILVPRNSILLHNLDNFPMPPNFNNLWVDNHLPPQYRFP
jgi:hypothetical protein